MLRRCSNPRVIWLQLVVVPVTVLAAFLCSCSRETQEKPGTSEKPSQMPRQSGSGLSLARLRNATYDIGMENIVVDLVEGEYEEHDPESMGYIGVWLTDHIAFGDLNSDGSTDAAVVLVWSGGGSGSFYFLTAVIDKEASPINTGHQPLGDRVEVKLIEIDNGVISVTLLTHAPDDPLCCPSQKVTRLFRLQGERLVALK